MTYDIPYKAGDKVSVLHNDGMPQAAEWVDATIINVQLTSYLCHEEGKFVLKITYLPDSDAKDFFWYEIVGEDEVKKRVKSRG